MSKIGQEARALMYDDQGQPVQFKGYINEDGFYVPTVDEEAEMQEAWRLAELANYTNEELENELDSRITGTRDVKER